MRNAVEFRSTDATGIMFFFTIMPSGYKTTNGIDDVSSRPV
jgi:hypothetical protein